MIQQTNQNKGQFVLSNMTNNLALTAANNYIDVGNGGTLAFNQHIAAAANNNAQGGVAFGVGNKGNSPIIVIEVGGTLSRSDVPAQGVPDSVSIAGAVYNVGGNAVVGQGQLTISAADAVGQSYWQSTANTAELGVGSGPGANISVIGTYEIDIGTVTLTTVPGAKPDELDGQALNFGNANPTAFVFTDSVAGTPGTIIVNGFVNLAAKTTTYMNFNDATNKADVLDLKQAKFPWSFGGG
jgi:hypothetical protein